MRNVGDWLPPLVHRELLGSSRKAWTYWLRFLTTLAAVIVLLVLAVTRGNYLGQNEGLWLFIPLSVTLFLTVSITGLRSTCDSVSRERREGTLGLLFLTDLKLSTILFSKLLSHSIQNTWALLAVLPVLGVCVLLGGVSGRLFLQSVLAILAALAVSLAIGLRQSCRKEDDHLAFSAGIRQVVLLNFVPLFSPLSLLLASFWQGIGPMIYFWCTFIFVICVSLSNWGLAIEELARNWQGQVAQVQSSAQAFHAQPSQLGHLKKPPRLCGELDPACWIVSRYGEFRQASPKGISWVFVGALVFIGICFVAALGFEVYSWGYLVLMGGGRFAQLLAMCKIAPQSFADIASHGALEILQTTPVTLRELIQAARRFLIAEYKKGLAPMMGFDLAMVAATLLLQGFSSESEVFIRLLLLQNALFLAALPAIGLTGIWLGIRHGNFARAAFRTSLLAVLPMTAFFFGSFMEVSLYLMAGYLLLLGIMAYRLRRIMAGGERLLKVLPRQ